MKPQWTKTILRMSIHHVGENPIYSESATHVDVEDEAGGPFIILRQSSDNAQVGEVRLDFEEVEMIAQVVKELSTQPGLNYD